MQRVTENYIVALRKRVLRPAPVHRVHLFRPRLVLCMIRHSLLSISHHGHKRRLIRLSTIPTGIRPSYLQSPVLLMVCIVVGGGCVFEDTGQRIEYNINLCVRVSPSPNARTRADI